MAQFQPYGMVMDCLYQYGTHAGTATAQGVGIDLIAYQNRLKGRNLEAV